MMYMLFSMAREDMKIMKLDEDVILLWYDLN